VSKVGGASWVVMDLDGPRRGGARQRPQPRLSHRLVDGQQGVERCWVGVAGERHLTEDAGKLAEEDTSARVPTFHLVHERRLVILHKTISNMTKQRVSAL